MATVKDLLEHKGHQVSSIQPQATVFEAATQMNDKKIGALVVIEDDRLVGMFTERDILQRVVAQKRDASQTAVGEVMTCEVACCRPHTTLDEARGVMKNRRIRHLPVVDEDGRLRGLVSIGDLNAHEAHDKEQTIHFLQEYICGHA